MKIIQVWKNDKAIKGRIKLDGSKSISNRALIIRALSGKDFPIHELANAKDTRTLNALLSHDEEIYDCGAAGTTFRFLTAYLALKEGTQILTGSERMKQRPIGVLVEALKKLGAKIEYMENEGYPPLKIHSPIPPATHHINITAGTSSQYISSLLMIAPTLENGLTLELEGKIVSRPYIEMTLGLMRHFGVKHFWNGNTIEIKPQEYQANEFTVEADWSAASYYFAMAIFADRLDLHLDGLGPDSFQGDSVLVEIGEILGVKTKFTPTGINLIKSDGGVSPILEWDFLRCPDVAQTMAVVCGGLGIHGLFSGLETLRIKETDRIAALKNELAKVQVFFSALPKKFSKKSDQEFFMVEGKAALDRPQFATYEDHRMAMAFAPLAMHGAIKIEEPEVVVKSYPAFWEDLQSLGFQIEEML